jgi:hypothetical protein
MRGCTCRGLTLCAWCAALAARAVGSGVAGDRALHGSATPAIARPPLSERAFMQAVRREALANKYYFYHTFDSRRSAPGFIDCVLAKPGRPLLCWELKTADGVLTLAQQRWIDVLQQVTHVEAGVYHPEAWEEICTRLREV